MFNYLYCAGEEGTTGNNWIMFVVIGVLLVVMMLFTIIPQRKRKKEAQEMMQSVRVGKKIKTIGGFVGEIVSIDDKQGTLELNVGSKEAPVVVVVDKAAIYTVLNPDAPVKEQTEQKTDEVIVPEAVSADDIALDAVEAEKQAVKKAKKDKKAKAKAEAKAEKVKDAEVVETENSVSEVATVETESLASEQMQADAENKAE